MLFCILVINLNGSRGRGTTSVAISSKCFPRLWRGVEASHVTLDGIFVV